MITTIEGLRDVLMGTPLEHHNVAELDIPETSENALAIEVNHQNALDSWQLFRSKVDVTKRWPVLIACWNSGSYSRSENSETMSWYHVLRDEEIFDRFPFECEHRDSRKTVAPESIIAGSYTVDLEQELAELAPWSDEDLLNVINYFIDDTNKKYGQSPHIEDFHDFIQQQNINNIRDLERWFLDWEVAHFRENATSVSENELGYIKWFEPKDEIMALFLLPTTKCWEVLAYISWYGAECCNSELVIALLRYWHQKYGAELVAHYGTMLQLITQTRPKTVDDAFQLAWEQETIAPCTTLLPGVALRDHVKALLHTNRWFLHERP